MNEMKPKWNLNTFAWTNEDKLPGFGKLLSSWLNVHRTFCEGAQPNFSWEWGHNEHSQLGFLANAATLIGGLSVAESWIKKDSKQDSEQGKKVQGRSDLWLRLCPPHSGNDYLIEAKIEQYLDVIKLNNASQKIAQQMKAARESAQRLKGKQEKIVAMAFLSLKFENENLDSLEQNTGDLISHIWNQSHSQKELDAIGAIWMGKEDFLRSKEGREKEYPGWKNVHFGMVLLASRMMI